MEKLMFYTNTWDDVQQFVQYYNQLIKSGMEVAFGTANPEVAKLIGVGKLLVVYAPTYYPDVIVYLSDKPVNRSEPVLSFEEFERGLK